MANSIYFYFTKFWILACTCAHACRCMCMCVHEWKPEEGHWVSCTIILRLTPVRQSPTEPGALPSLLPVGLASKPQGPWASWLSLPPPAPTSSTGGVCSDVRVLGNWPQVLKLEQQELWPTEPSPQLLTLPKFNVFRNAYQITFCYHKVILFL